jgi:hypothetical protein
LSAVSWILWEALVSFWLVILTKLFPWWWRNKLNLTANINEPLVSGYQPPPVSEGEIFSDSTRLLAFYSPSAGNYLLRWSTSRAGKRLFLNYVVNCAILNSSMELTTTLL